MIKAIYNIIDEEDGDQDAVAIVFEDDAVVVRDMNEDEFVVYETLDDAEADYDGYSFDPLLLWTAAEMPFELDLKLKVKE